MNSESGQAQMAGANGDRPIWAPGTAFGRKRGSMETGGKGA
jgi:hypothetical protein